MKEISMEETRKSSSTKDFQKKTIPKVIQHVNL